MPRTYHLQIKDADEPAEVITANIVADFKAGEAAYGAGESPQPDWPTQKLNGYKFAQGIAGLRRTNAVNAPAYGDPLWA